jgi:threonine dehydrogenase-like Zn-dependent dehydrogenase
MGDIREERKIRALRYHGNKDIRLEDVPDPVCLPGFIKIKNSWCGICGSGKLIVDVKCWRDKRN